MADAITTKNITSVDEVQSVDNTDKVFVNDNGSFKQISVSNLMKQAPSGVTEETDPTVSEWAKQPTKPSYTANEVGALPVGTKIPTKTSDLTNDSGYLTQIPEEYVTETELGQKGYVIEDDIPEKLPSPGTLTFTGAVNDTYDGSANKTINIPTGGGEGGTSDYNALANKPKLNGVEITGNKTSTDYKIVSSEQGIENNGKFLGIGVDGNVIPVSKPSYTATEVGADTSGTAVAKVSEHNTAIDAHSDIRLLVQGLTDRLNTLADSDDDTLDQMSEIVSYIKSNKRNATPLTDAGRENIPAIVSFIDDDCRSEVYTVLFPLIKNLEIPYTIACPTGNINKNQYITDAQLKEMYDYGVSVSCHTVNQTNMDTVDRNQLREILQQSIDDLSGWGINDVRTYAYCQGKYTIDNIQVVKEFFDMGFLTDKGINEIPYESYYMKRVGLFPSTDNFTLANAKEYVDQLSEGGGWLIFMTHCYTETFNSEELSELVAYIKGKSIPIIDINDAINKTGNIIEAGHYKKDDLDSGHYFVVDSLGRTHTDSVIGNSGEVVELVDLVLNEGHQIGKEASSENKGKDIEMTSGNTTHVVSRPVDVTDCTSVIITGWAYSGYGIYSFLNSSGECVSALWSTHSLAEGADSVENQEVSVPEGASTIIIAGHKDYIMPALKKVKSSGGDSGSSESYELPIMSDTQLGGGKAVTKTDEDVPVAVDSETGQLFVPTYPENTGGDTINVDAELKEYMNVAKPAIASAIINKGGNVEPDDSLNDYATRISAIPNDVYPAETLPEQTNLSASGLQESVGIKLNWSDVNASGYLILRKENAMPATSADGDIVYNGTYAADGYTDTGVQKGKVYYYRIFPRNSKNQYQSLEDGAVAMVDYKYRTGQTLLGDLPLGTKIKFGQWNGSDFFWEVVDTLDKTSGFVTVAADQNLGNRQFDAPEPSSPISNRKTQGNNRWAYSAARQLLNSDADADAWWTAQYEYDAEPSYASQIPGFLKDFTEYEKSVFVVKTNKCILPNDDGGGTETTQDKVWFPSYYAMGLGVIQPLEDDHIYEKFTDNASRSYQNNYWLRSINGAESPSVVRVVSSYGSAGNSAAYGSSAVRPFCQLPTSAYMTWSDSDEAYVFADDSQRNPLAT